MRLLKMLLLLLAVLLGGLVAFDFLLPSQAAQIGIALERSRAGLAEQRLSIVGFDMAYLDGGSGEPLVLVHGFGANKDNFTRVAGPLTPHYRVIAPDLPGFGDSSKPVAASYTIAEQVERLHQFLQVLKLERVHLGGSSMGGFIATAYAATYPQQVASLWLLAPAGTEAAFDSELRRTIEASGENPLLAKTPQDFARTYAFVMADPPFLPYSVKRVLSERAAANYELHARIFTQIKPPASPMLESYVRDLPTPALIVWGTQDRALNPRGAEAMQALLPNAEIVRMDGIGHLPMIEAPRRAAQDWLKFARALPPG